MLHLLKGRAKNHFYFFIGPISAFYLKKILLPKMFVLSKKLTVDKKINIKI